VFADQWECDAKPPPLSLKRLSVLALQISMRGRLRRHFILRWGLSVHSLNLPNKLESLNGIQIVHISRQKSLSPWIKVPFNHSVLRSHIFSLDSQFSKQIYIHVTLQLSCDFTLYSACNSLLIWES
jgi:hypothetical protein